jgi:hypothetical protein
MRLALRRVAGVRKLYMAVMSISYAKRSLRCGQMRGWPSMRIRVKRQCRCCTVGSF